MYFKQAMQTDFDTLMTILQDGRAQLAEAGINQWQGDYPNVDQVKADIAAGNAYLFNDDTHETVGTVTAQPAPDDVYDSMDGTWLINTDAYLTIHRLAIHSDHAGNGYATKLFTQAIDHIISDHPEVKSLRVDTHVDNLAMQRIITTKMGFEKVGTLTGIYHPDDKCFVYEKVIECENNR